MFLIFQNLLFSQYPWMGFTEAPTSKLGSYLLCKTLRICRSPHICAARICSLLTTTSLLPLSSMLIISSLFLRVVPQIISNISLLLASAWRTFIKIKILNVFKNKIKNLITSILKMTFILIAYSICMKLWIYAEY